MKSTQGKPLYSNILEIFQLQYDEPGIETVKKVLLDYKGTVAALNTLNINSKGPVKGSNIYFRFAIGNSYRELTKENIRPINPRESEIALANNTLINSNSTYEDLGLVVYPNKGSNPILYNHLREQVKSNFKDINLKQPFILTGLMDVIKDDRFENVLRLDINNLTETYNVPILGKDSGTFDSNDPKLQETGFPSKLGQGNRTLYTASDSVRGFYRNRNLNLGAGSDNLAYSDDAGGVHFVKNFSSGNLDELVKNLELALNRA